VARNLLMPGGKLPSQRELAEAARVNPNTVQRAYREMEAMGLVETKRGGYTNQAFKNFLQNPQDPSTARLGRISILAGRPQHVDALLRYS
jgi:DNA-binding transcriptional regulator YhcF (GntR family)